LRFQAFEFMGNNVETRRGVSHRSPVNIFFWQNTRAHGMKILMFDGMAYFIESRRGVI
jgi:hypothetical protein